MPAAAVYLQLQLALRTGLTARALPSWGRMWWWNTNGKCKDEGLLGK